MVLVDIVTDKMESIETVMNTNGILVKGSEYSKMAVYEVGRDRQKCNIFARDNF